MKLNWGSYIVIAFVAFGAFIVTLVVKTFAFKPELVSETYYEDEIKYQSRIEMLKNAQANGAKVKWELKGDSLLLLFPKNKTTGKVHLMRPSNKDFDKKFDLNLKGENQFTIPTKEILAGLYLMKVEWTSEGKSYYMEQNITL